MGIRVRVVQGNNDDLEFSAIKTLELEIEHVQGGEKPFKVGSAIIWVIDISMMRRNGGFFHYLEAYSHELGKLALHFDREGRLLPNPGCWQAQDFENEWFLVYLEKIIINEEWRGRGLATWLLPRLFHLDGVNGAHYIFTWPTVLNFLEPISANGLFGGLTQAENMAWLKKQERIIELFRKVGFRRLANSEFFFCLAKKSDHASHSVPIEQDAPFEELPPATTEEEKIRRALANDEFW
ncbi:hypothetical protein K438DRAFT_1996900 [Mycena galopus ATCC 62051]|nr:hypothetical protein K438DRAFT_1996900 [Mycena galopus ATCC 62051]